MLPQARKDNLTVRDLPGETLIYDLTRNKAHCLNRTASLIWQHCDGRTSPAQLATFVEKELGLDQAKAVVHLALEQLTTRNLLEKPVAPLSSSERLRRRDALRKLVVTAALIPTIMTITAQNAAAQASKAVCQKDADCGSNTCNTPKCNNPGTPAATCTFVPVADGPACTTAGGMAGTCQGGVCVTA